MNTVRNGGLKVHTTIDPRLQAAAHQAIANHEYYGGPSRALISIDPSNGHIVAMASSQTYSSTAQFNLAANAHRQAGSSFKPFVLTAAIRQGMDPDSTYYSGKAPVTLHAGRRDHQLDRQQRRGGSGGTMSVRDATVGSVNAVYAQLDLDVGPEEVRDTAYDMGITTHLDAFPAEGIGGLRIGVTPLEMANAYATLANGGIRNTATAISKVEFPNGDTDVPEEEERTRAFSDGVAYEVTDVLKGVITSGTAAGQGIWWRGRGRARREPPTTTRMPGSWATRRAFRPRSGLDHADARTSMGSGAFGGTRAAPIWHDYMLAAQGSDCPDFPAPENPVEFSTWTGSHTVGQPAATPSYATPGGAPRPGSTDGGQPGSTNGQYPPGLYAPGAGDGPRAIPGWGRRRWWQRRRGWRRRRRRDRRRGSALTSSSVETKTSVFV